MNVLRKSARKCANAFYNWAEHNVVRVGLICVNNCCSATSGNFLPLIMTRSSRSYYHKKKCVANGAKRPLTKSKTVSPACKIFYYGVDTQAIPYLSAYEKGEEVIT